MENFSKTKKFKLSCVAVVALLSTCAGYISIGDATAHAACVGTGNYYSSYSSYGYESSQSSTCDGLNDYNGLFQDVLADGYRVYIRTRLINGNTAYINSGLTNSLNSNYYYSYTDNNSSTYYQICNTAGICASEGHNWGF